MSRRGQRRPAAAGGVLAIVATLALLLAAPSAQAAFGFLPGSEGFDVSATELDGSVDAKAATHPYTLTTTIAFNLAGSYSDGDIRSIRIDRPAGLVENPAVMGKCSITQFNTPRNSPFQASLSGESCPDDSQVGTVAVHSSFGGGMTRTFGVFNLAPPPGSPALLGASPFGMPIIFGTRIRDAEGEYGLSLEADDISQQLNVSALKLAFWGNPWLVGHDRERGNCLNEEDPAAYFGEDAVLEREPQTKPETPPFYEPGTCSVGNPKIYPPRAYLTLPTSCAGPMSSLLVAGSWQQPGVVSRVALSHDQGGSPQGLEGCDARLVEREAGTVVPTTDRAASATGLDFNIDRDQHDLLYNFTPAGRLIPLVRAPSQVKRAVVALPEGMTLNPSVAAGLGVCTPAQYAAETVSSLPGAGCPNDSRIGELTLESPLFEAPITGGLFIAEPYQNPFGSLLALYLVAKDPERGVIVKIAGKVDADPATGRLVATFDQLPQLPYAHLKVHFREGQRSPLATPPACGGYAGLIDLNPWIDPNLVFQNTSRFNLTSGIGGGPCPASDAPFAPRADSGTMNRNAGSYTPFYLHLTRSDTDQEITGYSAQLPPGLLGRIAGIPFCPEAAIAAAKVNSGFAETAHPSCPAASRIGHTTAGYGVGSVLAYAPGGLYLAGPYHGAPLSVVAIDSATVGPFDLGVIIVRSAIRIDPLTAQVSIDSAGSDPIPHIIKGIPLHLRDIRVYIDRPDFTVNPTSCEPFAVTSTLSGSGARFSDPSDDTSATVTDPFQVSFCSSLGFAPRLALRLIGGKRRGKWPTLRATVTPRVGDANIGAAVVTLPASEFLAQNHIRAICSGAQFARHACPPRSVYGWARAETPLLEVPLEGPVVLRTSKNTLPDLAVALSGRGVDIEMAGRIDAVKGRLRATFSGLPDASVSRFTMTLRGGAKRGLLVNSDDICTAPPATAMMTGQNNLQALLRPKLENSRCKKHRRATKRHRRHRGRAH